MTDIVDAEVIDLKTRVKRPVNEVSSKTANHKIKGAIKKVPRGFIVTQAERRIAEAVLDLRNDGGFYALGKLNDAVYEWAIGRGFVKSLKSAEMRSYRFFALLGCCLEELTRFYNEDEIPPDVFDVARLLRSVARKHQRYWLKKGKK